MPQPEADYTFEFDADEKAILAELQAHPMPSPPPAPSQLSAQDNPDTDRALAVIQSQAAAADAREQGLDPATEGIVVTDEQTVEFMGRKFRIAEKIGLMPLLKFSAASDMSTDNPQALSALYSMLRDCIYRGKPGCGKCAECKADNERGCTQYDEGDWGEFERHAIDTQAEAEELLDVIQEVLAKLAGRPTAPPAGSSRGQRATSGSSTARSSKRQGRGSRR